MLDRAFEPGFRARLHRKDARIVLGAAEASRSPIPSFRAFPAQLDRSVDDAGRGDLDHSALFTLLDER
jgi:3-hydroxyisobutyrate dehydrogenase-like beta-hydroxyacid dehydrogenase